VERKARFIAQVMRGRLDVREIEDIGDAALSYNEVKALATGNPLLMEKAEADAELTRLQRAERAHHRNRDALRYQITSSEQRIHALTALISDIDAAIAGRRDTRGDAFTMTVQSVPYKKRNEAGHRLVQFLGGEVAALANSSRPRTGARLAHLGGFDVTAVTSRVLGTIQVVLALDAVPGSEIRLTTKDLAETDPAGLVIRLENRLTGLESLRTRTVSEIDRLRTEVARAREDALKPFLQAVQLAAARDHVRRIEEQLKEAATAQQRDGCSDADGVAAHVLAALGSPTPAHDVNGAGNPSKTNAIDGASWDKPAHDRPILRGGQVPNGAHGHQPPEAVRITQRGFPENNPLTASTVIGTANVSRPAAPPGRSARPVR